MRAILLALCAALVFATTAQAQKAEVPTTPIGDCSEIVGQRHNPYDEPVDLDFTDKCHYKIKARGRIATGVAVLRNGTLTIKHTDPETGSTYRFELRRSGENLSGTVVFPILFVAMTFPIQFFPVKK